MDAGWRCATIRPLRDGVPTDEPEDLCGAAQWQLWLSVWLSRPWCPPKAPGLPNIPLRAQPTALASARRIGRIGSIGNGAVTQPGTTRGWCSNQIFSAARSHIWSLPTFGRANGIRPGGTLGARTSAKRDAIRKPRPMGSGCRSPVRQRTQNGAHKARARRRDLQAARAKAVTIQKKTGERERIAQSGGARRLAVGVKKVR